MPMRFRPFAARLALAAVVSSSAVAQLRVVAWNISNYNGGRTAAIHASVYGEFEGRSMSPDVFVLQEFLSQGAVDQFVAALNSAPGSPGDWTGAAFVNGPDTDSAFAYRTSRVQLIDAVLVATGGSAPNFPRNLMRYDIRPVGYSGDGATIAMYSVHMKAGSSSTDQQRRLVEAQTIRADAEQLSEGWSFLVGGDFNIQSSNQAAYQELVGSQFDNTGRVLDPIGTPGSWNNNGAFRFVHTQDPIGAGGMDDRHDQILLSESFFTSGGFEYVGVVDGLTGLPVPYSTNTWDDPNHSYRSWGNDGETFNQQLRTAGNTMVGPVIAQALKDMCAGAGHLPVFLDVRVPGKVGADPVIDFGVVSQGASAIADLEVFNAADVAVWTEGGISDLTYELVASSGLDAPDGSFTEGAGGGTNSHAITLDTSSSGAFMGTVTILSDDPDQPVREVAITAMIVASCEGDTNGDGVVNFVDLNAVLSDFGLSGNGLPGDANGDGVVNFEDLNEVLSNFGSACGGA